MSDNWIVANLENAFATWNDKMSEIWGLVTMSPQEFKGGAIWDIVTGINGALQAIGYGLLILFFAMSIFKSTASFRDFQRPEYALKHFIRFVAAKVAITYSMDIITTIYTICGGVVESIADILGGIGGIYINTDAESHKCPAFDKMLNDCDTIHVDCIVVPTDEWLFSDLELMCMTMKAMADRNLCVFDLDAGRVIRYYEIWEVACYVRLYRA